MQGDSCRARRSSARCRATPSPHSLLQRESSCLAALGTSSRTAAETMTRIHVGKAAVFQESYPLLNKFEQENSQYPVVT